MATLKKGISFRRQGSSGLIWADNWNFTEDGLLIRGALKDENVVPAPPVHLNETAPTISASPVMRRSKSVGNAYEGTATQSSNHKSGFRVVKWLKKAFTKVKR